MFSSELETTDVHAHTEEKYRIWKWLLFRNYSKNILHNKIIYLPDNKNITCVSNFIMWNADVRGICLISCLRFDASVV